MAVKSTTTCSTCRCETALCGSSQQSYETISAYRTTLALGFVMGLGPLGLAADHFNGSTHISGGVPIRKDSQQSPHSADLTIADATLLSKFANSSWGFRSLRKFFLGVSGEGRPRTSLHAMRSRFPVT